MPIRVPIVRIRVLIMPIRVLVVRIRVLVVRIRVLVVRISRPHVARGLLQANAVYASDDVDDQAESDAVPPPVTAETDPAGRILQRATLTVVGATRSAGVCRRSRHR